MRTYRVAANEACERALQDWTAEYSARMRPLLDTGTDPDQATQRVMAEMHNFNRELRASLADDLLAAETDFPH